MEFGSTSNFPDSDIVFPSFTSFKFTCLFTGLKFFTEAFMLCLPISRLTIPAFSALLEASMKFTTTSSELKVLFTTNKSETSTLLKSLIITILPGLSPKMSFASSIASLKFVVVAFGFKLPKMSAATFWSSSSRIISGMCSASIMLFFPLSTLLASLTAFSNLAFPPSSACMDALASRIIMVFSRVMS